MTFHPLLFLFSAASPFPSLSSSEWGACLLWPIVIQKKEERVSEWKNIKCVNTFLQTPWWCHPNAWMLIFSSMLGAHGNGTRGLMIKKPNLSNMQKKEVTQATDKAKMVISPHGRNISSKENMKHFPISVHAVNLFWTGTKATLHFHSLGLKLQKSVRLCRCTMGKKKISW